jgi:hypothetical protein
VAINSHFGAPVLLLCSTGYRYYVVNACSKAIQAAVEFVRLG